MRYIIVKQKVRLFFTSNFPIILIQKQLGTFGQQPTYLILVFSLNKVNVQNFK